MKGKKIKVRNGISGAKYYVYNDDQYTYKDNKFPIHYIVLGILVILGIVAVFMILE